MALVPSGRWRRRVLAAVPGVWAATLGYWLGFVWLGPVASWLLVGVGLVVVAGGAELWLWWADNRRGRLVPVLVGSVVLVALVPTAFVYWVWHQSAHLGTAGEPTPVAATSTWMDALAPGGSDSVSPEIYRVSCTEDKAARRRLDGFIRLWKSQHERMRKANTSVTMTWLPDRARVHGDTATVPGTMMMSLLTQSADGSPVTLDEPETRWTFTVVREDGWRVCGLTAPGWPAKSDSSASPSPTPAPPSSPDPADVDADASPSPTDDDEIPGGAPSDMQKCGPRDPYKDMGWYDCP
ncbi:hypothetical protein [Actinocatenispora rupis]|uniref:hypothetical protein n=1 Tax=Actinocatenispora rupis TaxID=519421 RepID=UPI0031F104A5